MTDDHDDWSDEEPEVPIEAIPDRRRVPLRPPPKPAFMRPADHPPPPPDLKAPADAEVGDLVHPLALAAWPAEIPRRPKVDELRRHGGFIFRAVTVTGQNGVFWRRII